MAECDVSLSFWAIVVGLLVVVFVVDLVLRPFVSRLRKKDNKQK